MSSLIKTHCKRLENITFQNKNIEQAFILETDYFLVSKILSLFVHAR